MVSSYGSVKNGEPKNEKESPSGGEDRMKSETTSLIASSAPKQSFISTLVFSWFSPLLDIGNAKQRLDQEDLETVPFPQDCWTEDVSSTFEKYWKEDHSVIRALFRAFGKEYIRAGFLKLLHDLCVFVGPQVLHAMIEFLRSPTAPMWHGFALTAGVTVSQLLMSLCLRHYFFKCYNTGLRVRSAVVMAVYKKALVLSSSERQTRSLGEITNLMSIDSQRLQDLPNYLHALWYSPLQISLALGFLWQQLGASSLGGVVVIIITIPLTKYMAQTMGEMQKTLMESKDKRVDLNSEVLANMKVIKFQAWEESFLQRISSLRNNELAQLLKYLVGLTWTAMVWNFTPLLVAMATFAVYVWLGHELDVATALTSLALFAILRFPLFMLPQVINNAVEAMVAIDRIRSFLLAENYEPIGPGDLQHSGIRMNNVSAVYDSKKPKVDRHVDAKTKELFEQVWTMSLLKSQLEDAEQEIADLKGTGPSALVDSSMAESSHSTGAGSMTHEQRLLCLRRINFELKPGELVAVVGGVGCGKSSFLNAILGEVHQVNGETAVRGSVAYFPQTPFILNATVRENILFGHVNDPVIDEALYQRAIKCCALEHDLELLTDGDQTEIGEKGINLSGGQKARIALARAVYHQADVTVIDDALSAVDAHVAKQLFDEAIAGEFLVDSEGGQSRCVVLVTNAIQHLRHPFVDRIYVLRGGRVVEVGTYEELSLKKGSFFSNFLNVIGETGVGNVPSCEESGGAEGGENEASAEELDRRGRHRGAENEEKSAHPLSPAKLMTDEVRSTGHVDWKVYDTWFRAAGGCSVPLVIFFSFALGEGASVASNWWLTYWSAHAEDASQNYFLGVYGLINLATGLIAFLRMLVLTYIGLRASRTLFDDMLGVVMFAPMSFFDTTPVGRIVNRFSKDMYTIDESLMPNMRTYLSTIFSVASTVAVISGVTPFFMLCLVPMILFYINEQRYFTVTYRELKRLDSVNRSPIYALLGETVDGVTVIRSFSAENALLVRLISMLDKQQHAYYLTCAAQSWLAVRLELIGTLIITFSCLSAVVEHWYYGTDAHFAGLAGLAISYSLQVTQSLNWSVRTASDLEANMVAVERVKEYTQLKNEAARCTAFDEEAEATWPSKGSISFNRVKMSYRPGLPLVLKGLDLKVPGGSKVGVVGRTGAGKSSLMVALMRIVELTEGSIEIDGQDISKIGLAMLRRKMAVIPQDPVLFSGTIRTNLDPFDEYSDETLYGTLERVGLYAKSRTKGSTNSLLDLGIGCIRSLDDTVCEGGSNFSVGQRQLLVIGRALMRGAKIVVMDEATAAVDAETDAAIQKVIRNEFANATCITVAHRVNTIMDSDFVLVMSDGRAAEFDKPSALLKRDGMFRDLVKASNTEYLMVVL